MSARHAWVCCAVLALPAGALAQVVVGGPEGDDELGADEAPEQAPDTSLRGRFGAGMSAKLLRWERPEERARGIERAGNDGSGEAVALLTQIEAAALRADPRILLELARALAGHCADDSARTRLLNLAAGPRAADASRSADGGDDWELVRATASMALAGSGNAKSVDELVKVARTPGAGQAAALAALAAFGISPYAPGIDPPASAALARAFGATGDLRLLEPLLSAARGASDAQTRAAAIVALGHAGDQRALDVARAMMGEQKDARLRIAAAETMALLDAPERFRAVEVLIADPGTASAGVRLAENVQDTGIVLALIARMATMSAPGARESVLVALGHGSSDEALGALVSMLADARLGPAAAQAIARSPHPGAMAALEKMNNKRLAMRAYVVRRAVRGDKSAAFEALASRWATSTDARERALAALSRGASGAPTARDALSDVDPRVRRAAAMGAQGPNAETAVLEALRSERDPATRVVLSRGLAGGDPSGRQSTSSLVDRAEAGGPDAPLGALALAARAQDAGLRGKVATLLASRDPVMRSFVARGLAMSAAPESTGQLAEAYRYERDADVRRAIIVALAARQSDSAAPARSWALALAAKLDPDSGVRLAAERATTGTGAPAQPAVRDIAWLTIATAPGATLPSDLCGTYVSSDGNAVPFVFDDDGFALVPGVAPGPGRVVLAPRVR